MKKRWGVRFSGVLKRVKGGEGCLGKQEVKKDEWGPEGKKQVMTCGFFAGRERREKMYRGRKKTASRHKLKKGGLSQSWNLGFREYEGEMFWWKWADGGQTQKVGEKERLKRSRRKK